MTLKSRARLKKQKKKHATHNSFLFSHRCYNTKAVHEYHNASCQKRTRTPATINTCAHTLSRPPLGVFVVGPAAHVAVTEAICLWHFALFLSSPHRRADRFYSSLVPGEPPTTRTHTHTHTHKYTHSPSAIPLSSIHTHTYFCRNVNSST